jgi:hypothetical protein
MFPVSDVPLCCTDAIGFSVSCSDPAAVKHVNCPGQSTSLNQIGLFTLQIPKTGLGTGTVVIFAAGLTFSGTFQGAADPDTGKLTGEIDTTTTVTIGSGGGVETASGNLNARLKANRNTFSTTSVRIKGRANIQFSRFANNPFDEVVFKVSGFKQAEAGQ